MAGFRAVCRWLHRELGFVAVGLTLVYAISGVAVNHAHHWDASYQHTSTESRIDPVGRGSTEEVLPLVLERLQVAQPVKSTWRAAPELLQVFVEDSKYTVNLDTGGVLQESIARRPFLFQLNFMHLNKGKGPWTLIADVYAVVLAILAISGIFLIKGRKGLAGRGGILLAAGIVLPLLYVLLERTSR